MPKVHELKTWSSVFLDVVEWRKPFEFRFDDRGFEVGDELHLKDFDPEREEFTGEEYRAEVKYIVRGPSFGIPDGFVIMSIEPAPGQYDSWTALEAAKKIHEKHLEALGKLNDALERKFLRAEQAPVSDTSGEDK